MKKTRQGKTFTRVKYDLKEREPYLSQEVY